MRLYEGSISEFNSDVANNLIADKVSSQYKTHYQRPVAISEFRSWQQSLNYLKNSFEASLLKENKIVVEYELPYSSRRIDVLLFGSSSKDSDDIVLIELKQWSNDSVDDCPAEGNVIVNYGGARKEQAHPSLQVEGYHYDLQNFLHVFEEQKPPELSSCAYCHNYARLKEPRVLFEPKFKDALDQFPVFAKEDVAAFGKYLRERLARGSGFEVFNRFITSTVRPSKRLLEHTGEMINKRQIFTLIDDQIAAYNAIMHRAKSLAKKDSKAVVIVKGGPGTGKSVIALEVMGELLRQGKSVIHATGSSAFTNTLRKIVGPKARGLFKFFNSFIGADPDQFDVLVADEAHRIRATSANMYTPRAKRTGEPQIDELLHIAKLCIFFIDEKQIVRPNEVGSIQLIRDAAERFGVPKQEIPEFELQTQFRCSGSDAYLQWIDHVLGIRQAESPRFDSKMEFRVFDDPAVMMNEIRARNREKDNCARITAGFCWAWNKPNRDGSLPLDVKIGSFEMPWEKKDAFWKWATDDSGMEQVGTVYTAQGFEFDYIGVIFGNDLVYHAGAGNWAAVPKNSFDTQVKRKNPSLTEHLKSVYRVLLSRAHKGVYIYFMDEGTKKYFLDQMGRSLEIDQEDPITKTEFAIVLDIPIEERFQTYLPVYSLAAAAGAFGEAQEVLPLGWTRITKGRNLSREMFVARVVGKSMEPTIRDGAYCIFRIERGGSRNGKIVLVQSRHIDDPDNGGQYTVKRYHSEKALFADGTWRHKQIILTPDNRDFRDIVLTDVSPDDFKVIAEFVSALN